MDILVWISTIVMVIGSIAIGYITYVFFDRVSMFFDSLIMDCQDFLESSSHWIGKGISYFGIGSSLFIEKLCVGASWVAPIPVAFFCMSKVI